MQGCCKEDRSGRLSSIIAIIHILLFMWLVSPVNANEIWIGGLAKWEHRKLGSIADGAQMFEDGADWQRVAEHTRVVKFGPGNIEHASDAELQRVFSDLKRRKIAVALEDSVLVRSERCKSTTEAYGNSGAVRQIIEKIRRNGGDLRYVAMDEPFYYGYQYSGPSACHESMSQIASEVAETVQVIRSIFPEAKIGDIEVVDTSRPWIDELAKWADAYKAAVGEQLAFLHADVAWSLPAMHNLVPLSEAMKKRGVPFGIIYNGEETAQNDEAWTTEAIFHYTEIESALRVIPDQAIFQTWSPYPTRMLPEGKPGTLTNVALRYISPPSDLVLHGDHAVLFGQLKASSDNPIREGKVSIEAIDVEGQLGLSEKKVSGKVPQDAVSAIIGIRVNTEGSCACGREGTAKIGTIHYLEEHEAREQSIHPDPKSSSARLIMTNEVAAPNLREISVTPGSQFMFSASMSVTATAENAGYVAIIFRDKSNNGLSRRMIPFSPSILQLATVTTDAFGRFEYHLPATVVRSHAQIRAYYPGGNESRPAMTIFAP